MTDLDLSLPELDALESSLANELAIPLDTQELLFRSARTANAFTAQEVGDDQVRAVYELVKWAPTAMNSQPLRIATVRRGPARERLVTHMAPGNQAKTLAAPMVAVLAADLDFHDQFVKTFPANPGAAAAFADPERRASTARMNTALQIGYFIVAARAAGLAAGPMAGFDAAGMTVEFFPDGHHEALLVVNLGYPAADAYRPRQPRLDFDDVVRSR